jgi:PPK2 family polyphosphate:nucleotide phosphotransferase
MEKFKIKPGDKVKLADFDPNDSGEFKGSKEEGLAAIQKLTGELENLQERLYSEGKHKLLVVLQGMDTSGKDGTIRAVFQGVNPQGVRVASFKVPTPEELAHDYLWRVHKQTPGKGEIVIFNRSHYEDVLVVRVHKIVPESVWRARFEQINAFERLLVEEGTTILKFFLHIDLDEQKNRLLERLNVPEKQWKFNPGDLDERALWKDYQAAYQDVLEKTSTDWAPWYVVPANKNWHRNLFISSVLVETLKKMNIQTPPAISAEEIKKYKAMLA